MRVLKTNDFFGHRQLLNHYPVLPDGRVLSKSDPARDMHAVARSKGLVSVDLSMNGEQFRAYVHILVALMYVPIPAGGRDYTLQHKDGNKLNNHMDNLEWLPVNRGITTCPCCGEPLSHSKLFNPALQSITPPQ